VKTVLRPPQKRSHWDDLPGTLDGADEAIVDVPDALQDRPQILYNKSYLPKPVARMHSQMMEAALSGDINRMRIILESNEVMPTLSFGEIEDPIDFLKESSGDGEGFESSRSWPMYWMPVSCMWTPALRRKCMSGRISPAIRSRI
jgi:hypothetical protein